MKTTTLTTSFALLLGTTMALSSCEKKQEIVAKNEISEESLSQIRTLGFSTQNAKPVEGGIVVEGDILLTKELLSSKPEYSMLRVGQDEQYRTTNVVRGLPRVLTVRISSQFSSRYVQAIDEAIRRYNAQGLQLSFRRITSGTADLPVTYASNLGGAAGRSGGFPSNGDPAPGFALAPSAIGNVAVNTIATIMAHEIGHCIGFRHTDYFDRRYSCDGDYINEGASDVGAIRIPGTPSGADPNSWMLACGGSDRPFNANDRAALAYLYQ